MVAGLSFGFEDLIALGKATERALKEIGLSDSDTVFRLYTSLEVVCRALRESRQREARFLRQRDLFWSQRDAARKELRLMLAAMPAMGAAHE